MGERNELLRNLFNELAAAAIKIDPVETAISGSSSEASLAQRLKQKFHDRHWRFRQKENLKKALAGKFRAFGIAATSIGKIAEVADTLGVPAAKIVASAAQRSGEAADQFLGNISIAKRKSELVDALKLISRRIVVFIDDLDRLEPREVSEVLRLIRAVADFPNVIYVLSYDREVVAQTLTKAVQVDDGEAFLEKIVQVSFSVPRPEAFDLRRWFQSEVYKLFASELDALGESRRLIERRLGQVIDQEGGRYLETGRDVVRVLNALRLHGVPVAGSIDVPDMVWLQLVRIGNFALYNWIEEYLTEVAAISNGASLTGGTAESMSARLEELLRSDHHDLRREILGLGQVLPGLGGYKGDGKPWRVFANISGDALKQLIVERRLASPDHYRYYYAFSHPAGTLSDKQVQVFVKLAEENEREAVALFATLAHQIRPQGDTKAEILIDRLIAWSDRLREQSIPGIISAFAKSMDELVKLVPVGDFGEYNAWRLATRATELLLKRITGAVRTAVLTELFKHGRALGWLTDILRGEIFSHGHYGDHAKPQEFWLLSTDEFNIVLAAMLTRYREIPPQDLLHVPQLLNVLFAWLQGSGTDEAQRWAHVQTATDDGLLDFLGRTRSWAASGSIGVYHPLKRRDIEKFIDCDNAIRRLQAIASTSDLIERKQLAAEFLEAFVQGDRGH